jgi:hypothetical protein
VAAAVGYKLMYDQVILQFLTDGNFIQYLKENSSNVIHLVKEAKVLKIASNYIVGLQKVYHGTTNYIVGQPKVYHRTNKTTVEQLRSAKKMPRNN